MIARLESIALGAWPPRNTVDLDGWTLCEGGGFTRRINSVQTLRAGALALDDRIERAEAFYAERGLPAVFKLTDAAAPAELDAALARRGYRLSDPTRVQTLALGEAASDPPRDVRILSALDSSWVETCADIWRMDEARRRGLRDTLGRVVEARLPLALASIGDGGDVIAVGLAISHRSHVFLGEIATRADARRAGLGMRIMRALMAWGSGRGDEHALLQVVADNEPALALYRRLGFAERYRYWYREAPGKPD